MPVYTAGIVTISQKEVTYTYVVIAALNVKMDFESDLTENPTSRA